MAGETQNYKYPKPDAEDFYDIEEFNKAMDMIDGDIKKTEENLEKLNKQKVCNEPEFTQAEKRENIESGEKFGIILGKIKKIFADLKPLAFSAKWEDLKDAPEIPSQASDIDAVSNGYMNEHFVPDYVSEAKGTVNKEGWYRIAKAPMGNEGNSCTVSLKRDGNNGGSEYQKIQFLSSNINKKFVPLAVYLGTQSTHAWTKIRHVSETEFTGNAQQTQLSQYIEVFYKIPAEEKENTWLITIEDALGVCSNTWKAIVPTLTTETVSGTKIYNCLDIPESFDLDDLAKKDGSNLSIPTAPATNNESTAPGAFSFDSFFEPDGSIKLLKEIRTFLGTFAIGGKWSSVISVRHRNGFGDGACYGMYLRSKLTETGNLSWGKQVTMHSWQDERVILDSENYSEYALPLSGGSISGTIVSSVPPQTALDTLKGKAIINSIASGKTKGFVGLAKMNSTNGVFAQGVLDGAYIFGFAEDSTIAGNQSTMKYGVILLNEVGNSSFPGRVTASSFKGDVEGNATSATKANQDGDGNVIKNTYAKKSIYGDRSINMGGYVSETYGCSLGFQNDALGEYSSVLGGNLNRAKVPNSAVLCGEENDASGICSSVLGGAGNTSSNYGASVMGKYNKNMAGGAHINTQSGDVFVIGNGTGGSSRSNALRVTYSGNIYGTKAFQSSGADYAEFKKEWADGNPDNEDRVGYLVTIKNGLLYKANEGDYIVGITSGNPSVVGNADEDYYWKYERDEFNRIMMEDVPETVQKTEQKLSVTKVYRTDEDGQPLYDENGNQLYEEIPVLDKDGNQKYEEVLVYDENHMPVMVETGKIIKNARMKLAENYDSSLQENYIERKDRKEWDYVGQVGTLPVRDDGTCLPDHFCKCGKDGVATFAEIRGFDTFYVVERISENVVSVEMRG